MKQILFDFLVVVVVVVTIWFVYSTYREQIFNFFLGPDMYSISINSLPMRISVADDQDELSQGLSGVTKLDEFEGKLFVFPQEGRYAMWMKDMLIPLDMIWIDNDFKIVHIEEQVTPESFPRRFVNEDPARFVLEVSAFFVTTHKIKLGDTVTLPPPIIPSDLQPKLAN